MVSGNIQVARHEGVYWIRLSGDVRLTLCTAFDGFIRELLVDKQLSAVIVDCSQATGMDSTTLGQLARMALDLQQRRSMTAALFCPDADLRRLLDSMGLDELFRIEDQAFDPQLATKALPACDENDPSVRERILEAHRTLMSLNARNRLAFADLVDSLEKTP